MSKDEEKKYTFEENSEFFRSAMVSYLDEELKDIGPLDTSFMDQHKSRRRVSKKKRFSMVAIAAVALICVVTVFTPMMSNNKAYGDKGILHRLYSNFMGLGTDEEYGQDKDRESKVEITDMKDIDEARDLCEDLYVPEYIPEGYKLESLIVERSEAFATTASYIFKSGANGLSIIITYIKADDAIYNSNSDGKIIKLSDRLVRTLKSKRSVEVYTEDSVMMISGGMNMDEMIKIAKQLKK